MKDKIMNIKNMNELTNDITKIAESLKGIDSEISLLKEAIKSNTINASIDRLTDVIESAFNDDSKGILDAITDLKYVAVMWAKKNEIVNDCF